MRTYTADGRLHIARSHITKAAVNPYRGNEIPKWDKLGLDPGRIYYMLRDPEELARAAQTFRGLPILNKHIFITDFDGMDEQEKKKYIVGAVGSDVEFLDPYLDADTYIWEAAAIAGIETDKVREFSCSYRYEPLMSSGDYQGVHYDGIMTQIQANHLALVESGRAGNDVLAADQHPETLIMKRTKLGNALVVAVTTAFPKVTSSELEKVVGNAKRKTFGKPEREKAADAVLAMDAAIDRKQVIAVMDAMADIEDEPKAEDADEHAKDCDCKDCMSAKDSDEDEDDEEEKKRKAAKDKAGAKDKAKDAASKEDVKGAMDSLEKRLRSEFASLEEAKRDVRPVVGDVIAMDSAEGVYGFALDHMKIDHSEAAGLGAKRAMFRLGLKQRESAPTTQVAMDSATVVKRFPNAARFRVM